MNQQTLKIRHVKLCPVIGLGFWRDVYVKEETGIEGFTHNFILPFIRIQLGYFVIQKD